jgi:hypothetical protein
VKRPYEGGFLQNESPSEAKNKKRGIKKIVGFQFPVLGLTIEANRAFVENQKARYVNEQKLRRHEEKQGSLLVIFFV